MTDPGAFHWNELMTRDVRKAKDFYAKTLGWTYDDVPMGDMYGMYSMIKLGEQMIGGMFEMKGPMFEGQPDHWMPYIAVADVDALMKKVKDAGGTVVREPWDIPGVGRTALVTDAGGAMTGWMVPAPDTE